MKKNNNLDILRHSVSHVLAAAVLEMFPEAKFGIGPAIEDGFYYDFDLPRTLIPEDLPILEEKMRAIIKKNYPFERQEIEARKAMELFKKAGQNYKVELIKDLVKGKPLPLPPLTKGRVGVGSLSLYKTGNFVDLCVGPHLDSTGEIKPDAFKLLKISGAYWKGDEKNKMLQRIYGTAFENKKQLQKYLHCLEEAEKRDHRKLGRDLNLFSMPELAGGGLPVWHPKGALIRKTIEDFWKEKHEKAGYQLIYSPHIGSINIWKKSGHWNFYRENLYPSIKIENEEYLLKPMNCPFHIFVYQNNLHSYKELPIRYAELGTVYRYERSGVLHGLTRVRGFTQDDAHIFCLPEQLSEELVKIVEFGVRMLKTFGFTDYDIYLSTRPEKYIGTPQIWEKATKALKYALEKTKLKYAIDPGEGVFYGPKIDIKIKDSLGRAWQCTTIQVDFNMPERLEMTYVDKKGKKQRPIMIHRALLGSLERFIGVLLEHYAGALPVWLSPIQVYVIPVGSGHINYAREINKSLLASNIRTEIKEENETVAKKIREGELQKIPYMLIVGDKEMKAKSVRVRDRKKGDMGEIKIDKFLEMIKKEIEEKK